MTPCLTYQRHSLHVGTNQLEIDSLHRAGSGTPIVFLHGFGSTKEDYADIIHWPTLAAHPLLAYDAPGCGESHIDRPQAISLSLLVETAQQMIDRHGFARLHLVGHSMGGLTALLLAQQIPERIASFTSIEGNLAAEDCFLSRQVYDYPAQSDEAFFTHFIERTRQGRDVSSAVYAASLRHKVRCEAVRPIFRSMVEHSDRDPLLEQFLGLPCPVHFMCGEQNRHLSYLTKLHSAGARVSMIPHCGHFPMYSNPVAMWQSLAEFIQDSDH